MTFDERCVVLHAVSFRGRLVSSATLRMLIASDFWVHGGAGMNPALSGSGRRAHGAGYRVQGAGCRVQGAGCRVQAQGV